MFSHFSLPDIERVSRRTVFSALALGVVGLIVCSVLGAALVGLGLCIGIALGVTNFHLIQRSVAKVGSREDLSETEETGLKSALMVQGGYRRPLALNTLGRLFVISAIGLGLLFVSFDLGLGVMAGLAGFQLLLLVNVARSMFQSGALLTAGEEPGTDNELGAVTVPRDDTGEGI